MEAGRELDALVAEKVMGWRREPQPNGVIITELWFEPDGRQHLATGVPRFSADIAAAWQVVEHIATLWSTTDDGGRYQRFRDAVDDETLSDPLLADAKRMTLAICRAALAAVETSA